MKRVLFLFALLLIPFLSAGNVFCDKSLISTSYQSGDTTTSQTMTCNNLGNDTVTIGKTGSYFNLDKSSLASNISTIVTISFDGSAPQGYYSNLITFSDGSTSIPININVSSSIIEPPPQICRLIELPHTSTFRILQGEVGASSQIKVKVSSGCNDTMQGMTVTEQTQMAKPMFLQATTGDVEPGGEFSFTIGLDAIDTTTGQYSNSYTVSGSIGDNVYSKVIQLSTVVAIGTSPVDENSFTNLPTCTLEGNMNLNTTYSLICNLNNPNINIEVPYNEYFSGQGVSETTGKFEYKLTPKKVGTTKFLALFKYKGVTIGNPFEKSITISQGNVPISGTTLEVLFYQKSEKKELLDIDAGNVTILVKDNNTDSIVPNFNSYLNGNSISSSFVVEPNKNYELIVNSEGYLSKTITFTVQENPITITLSPEKNFYYVGESITITTSANASLLMDNVVVTSPYVISSEGNHTISAVKEGYTTTTKNVTSYARVSTKSMTPLLEEWKKGKDVMIELTKNTTWVVTRDGLNVASGTGSLVQFKLSENGNYDIRAEDYSILTKLIEGKGIWEWIKDNLLWVVGGAIVLGLIFMFTKKGSSDTGNVGYG